MNRRCSSGCPCTGGRRTRLPSKRCGRSSPTNGIPRRQHDLSRPGTAPCQRTGGVTVVTHSGLVCMEFGPNSGHSVVSLGGQFDPGSACFVGPAAEEAARRFFIDIAFLSTKGFLPTRGPLIVACHLSHQADHRRAGVSRSAPGRSLEIRPTGSLQSARHFADRRGDHRRGHFAD